MIYLQRIKIQLRKALFTFTKSHALSIGQSAVSRLRPWLVEKALKKRMALQRF